MRLLKERDVAIIYISHRLVEVFQLADKVTVLRDGKFVDSKPVSETDEDDLIRMMVGRTITDLFPKLPSEVGDRCSRSGTSHRHPQTDDVSFTVRSGEIVGMAGLVGSGRSETAQVIFGILKKDRAKCSSRASAVAHQVAPRAMKLGHRLHARGPRHARAWSARCASARTSRWPSSTRSRAWASSASGPSASAGDDIIEQLNIIATSGEQVVNKLSGGNQQKVVVGKWLASKPKMLIVDEPTRGVDVGAKAEIHRLMSELAQQGLGILMISSELPEIIGMSDRILVMRNSRLVAEFSRDGGHAGERRRGHDERCGRRLGRIRGRPGRWDQAMTAATGAATSGRSIVDTARGCWARRRASCS